MGRVTRSHPREAFDRDQGDRRMIKAVLVGVAGLLFSLVVLGWL